MSLEYLFYPSLIVAELGRLSEQAPAKPGWSPVEVVSGGFVNKCETREKFEELTAAMDEIRQPYQIRVAS